MRMTPRAATCSGLAGRPDLDSVILKRGDEALEDAVAALAGEVRFSLLIVSEITVGLPQSSADVSLHKWLIFELLLDSLRGRIQHDPHCGVTR